jgi:hypothetical protein
LKSLSDQPDFCDIRQPNRQPLSALAKLIQQAMAISTIWLKISRPELT